MDTKKILICTVGGSHQPILTAIREIRPDYVVFACSGRDQGTGRPGSDELILGRGAVVKADQQDTRPSLPNIPAQVGLADDSYEVAAVPADDLDEATAVISRKLTELIVRFPEAALVADYTGGTKSMTAALVTAVLEQENIDLQLVTGNRADLIKVRNGTETSAPANIDAIRLRRSMSPFLGAWKRYAYDEAAVGLADIRPPRNTALRNRLNRARDLSSAFAAWDRFEHHEAIRLLEIYQSVIGSDLGELMAGLRLLVKPSAKQEPALLLELWLNAERRAAQGRFDDAVARCYRLVEWTAQWLLKSCCNIDTSDITTEQLPENFNLLPGRNGRLQAGLFSAWELVGKLTDSAASRFAAEKLSYLQDYIRTRNDSILAHGRTPIGKDAWKKFRDWLQKDFLAMLFEEMERVRIRKMPPQLPTQYRWED